MAAAAGVAVAAAKAAQRATHADTSYSGIGLGLGICHRIIERHGGHIYATDSPGGGTSIHFTLPPAQGPVPLRI